MANEFGPVVRRMRLLGRDTANTVREFMGLTSGIDTISQRADTFEADLDNLQKAMARVGQGWLQMSNEIQTLAAKRTEIGNLPNLAERMSDTIMILEQVDELKALDYIAWATRTLNLQPDLYDVAVKEVSSHEGGQDRLKLLAAAISRLFG